MATDSSLLAEIERDVLDGRPLADLLRKCIMLGGRSGSQDLRDWASKELRGYQGNTDLPPCRSVSAPILIDAVTGNSWVKGQSVPESGLPDFVRDASLGNSVDLRQGVGELEALVQQGQSSEHSIRVSLPSAEIIGEYFDRNSGNPFQHTDRVYWSIAPSAIHGVIDNIRTTLTELVTELVASVPRGQEVPTAEQADNAFNVAVHGKKSQITITAPQISGGSASTIDQRTAGPAADPDPAWWTLGRKMGAFIVGMFIILGAIAAIIAIYK